MTRPAVSVMVPTYNRSGLLRACLDSLLAQTLRPAQVLVVDDGSTDDTPHVLESLSPRVESVRVPQGGKSRAINSALSRVTGAYLWIFDDDDAAAPDAIERMVAPFERDAELGFSFGQYWLTPATADGRLAEPLGTSLVPDVDSRGVFLPLLEVNFLSGAAIFARTTCYREVGGFDESLKRSQDYDVALRIARRFRGARVAGGPLFHQRQHAGARGPETDRFSSAEKNAKWLAYDQQIFRKLRTELTLDEYLPPGTALSSHLRQALLQRAAICARRDLLVETMADLTAIADGDDQTPLTAAERQLIDEGLARRSYYARGLRADLSALAEIAALARRSPAIAQLCYRIRRRALSELARNGQSLVRDALRGRQGHAYRDAQAMSRLVRELVSLQAGMLGIRHAERQ